MKVLFVTDDRSTYRAGNYYLAYLRAFERKHEVCVTDLTREPELTKTDLIVVGHGGQDLLLSRRTLRSYFSRAEFPEAKYVAQIASSSIPKIIFSKNDYKALDIKNLLTERLGAKLLITHSKSAVPALSGFGRCKTAWIPFGIDASTFRSLNAERPTHIGFRGNRNSEWNAGERDRFLALINSLAGTYILDVKMSQVGENFLLGDEYVSWLNSCHLVANTVSAIATVGPRYLESMACGCVPISPYNEYEGLLRPDEHYISVNSSSEMESKLREFFSSTGYSEALLKCGRELVELHTVDRHIDQILAMLD